MSIIPGNINLRTQHLSVAFDDAMRHHSLKADLVEHNWNLKVARAVADDENNDD